MSPTARLNLLLFLGIIVLAGASGAAFSYKFWGPAFELYWTEHWAPKTVKPAVKAGDRTIAECLGVSDYYSAHLTTYFLADSEQSAGGAVDDLRKYDEYCDHVPGTGKVILSVTLMEKEARGLPVAISFYQDELEGRPQGDQRHSFARLPQRNADDGVDGRPSRKISAADRLRRGQGEGRHHRNADRRRAMTKAAITTSGGPRPRRLCRQRKKPVT